MPSNRISPPIWIAAVIASSLLFVTGCEYHASVHSEAQVLARRDTKSNMPITLRELLAKSSTDLERIDIALANLLCAQTLPGAEAAKTHECLRTLDQWAERINTETQRHFYRFRKNPAEFDHSEGYFRMLMMAVVLSEEFGVRYNPALALNPDQLRTGDRFFANAEDVFLHGLLGPRRTGTCSSMPVLYVALGRRLGYPVKLVTTKAHLFVRWDGAGERLNLEATGRGMNRYDDAHFKQWPFPVADEEINAEGYLKSLTPAEELAVFLSIRGQCLTEASRLAEAATAYAEAARLAPAVRGYHLLLENARQKLELTSRSSSAQLKPQELQLTLRKE
jgi:hypothetical protein